MSHPPIPLRDDLRFPGHGLPNRAIEELEVLTPFGRWVKNQGLGKSANVLYDATKGVWQFAEDSNFEPQGYDVDATQLQITLCQPLAIPRVDVDLGADPSNQSGGFDNAGMMGRVYPGTAAPIAWPPFTARLKWGTGGTYAEAYIDWVNGTTINVSASALDLRAAVSPDAIYVPGTSGLYQLRAFLSPGWPRPGNAQRTVYVGPVVYGAQSNIFVLPPLSRDVTVIGADPTPTTILTPPALTAGYIRFFQDPAGQKYIGNYFVGGNQPQSFRIPNGAQYFAIVSGMEPTSLFSACFGLAV